MSEVHALPTPIVPHEWHEIDTSIDAEPPELLSPEQLDRYIDTVTDLLTAAGLRVTAPDRRDTGHLEVCAPRGPFSVELDIRDDRSTEWSITGGDEIPEDTPALRLAAIVAALLNSNAGTALNDALTTVVATATDTATNSDTTIAATG